MNDYHHRDFRGPTRLPLSSFNVLETLSSKSLQFPSRYLFAIGITEVVALGGVYHPIKVALPSNSDSKRCIRIEPSSYGPRTHFGPTATVEGT
ncbi:hypothetical protein JTE90_026911 [Oedothorax gibbosus]|uniref:Uncharacterized protein n=1 Tax=Oedothorax gibbosus TaxID=931172 RepID=A0AAV6TCU3_9ARAC|nr:hypothetical protein JTE90_026911 [Oedothorax gibbosus]